MRFRTTLAWSACALLAGPATLAHGQGFVERANDAGLVSLGVGGFDQNPAIPFLESYLQYGSALGDVDGDLDLDVAATGHATGTKLFRNDGTGNFTIDPAAGIAGKSFDNCLSFGDMDRDGDLDLFVGVHLQGHEDRPGQNRLYRNDGTGSFEDVTALMGHRGNGHTLASKWFDFDYDGDLDIYVAEFQGAANSLLINEGTGTFTNRAPQMGLDVRGATHVVAVADMDGNGYADLMVGNDFLFAAMVQVTVNSDDRIFMNTGGVFSDATAGANFDHQLPNPPPNAPVPGSGTMGISIADVNYDGLLDVYKTERWDHFLLVNNGWPTGSPYTQEQDFYGVNTAFVPDSGGTMGICTAWGTKFFHADLDPWIDLFKVSGRVAPGDTTGQPNYMWRGDGPTNQFKFTDTTDAWGLRDFVDDRALAVGDIDRDGDMDLVLVPPGSRLRYFENQVPRNGMGWLVVEAETHTSAPGGAGTVVRWTDSSGFPHVLSIGSDGETASQHENVAHFGLGNESSVDLTVEFPSGMTREYLGVTPNQRLTVVEPEMISLSTNRIHPGGGLVTVTAFAHDVAGNALDGSAAVSIFLPGFAPTGPVQHVGGNEFVRTFDANPQPGAYRVEVSFDGFTPRIRPTVNVVGRAKAANTNIVLTPDCVRANSGQLYELAVVPRDGNGIAIGPGHALSYAIGAGALADHGDGRYSVDSVAPNKADGYRIDVDFDATTLNDLGMLSVGSRRVSPFLTTSVVEDVIPDFGTTPHQLSIRVEFRDTANRRIGTDLPLTVLVLPDLDGEPAMIQPEVGVVLHDDGTASFVIERDINAVPGSATGRLRVIAGNVIVLQQEYAL